MKSSHLELLEAYEYESPVEFVLVATIGRERAVVAKSKGAGIDLASYAQKSKSRNEDRQSSLVQVFYPVIDNLSPLSVDSDPLQNPRTREYDGRGSEFTLVWRGKDRPGLTEEVKVLLDEVGFGLTEAIENGSSARVEWLLSPVLAKCTEALIKARYLRLAKATRFKLMAVVLISYTLVAAAAYFYLYVIK
ncbi:TPA: hypothetical protein KNH08_001191 [Serratia fonticola]|nr:hypothetical protein [Serratia fonticola]